MGEVERTSPLCILHYALHVDISWCKQKRKPLGHTQQCWLCFKQACTGVPIITTAWVGTRAKWQMPNGSSEECAEHVYVILLRTSAYYGRNLREPGIPTEQVEAEAGEGDKLVSLILFLSCVQWGLGNLRLFSEEKIFQPNKVRLYHLDRIYTWGLFESHNIEFLQICYVFDIFISAFDFSEFYVYNTRDQLRTRV